MLNEKTYRLTGTGEYPEAAERARSDDPLSVVAAVGKAGWYDLKDAFGDKLGHLSNRHPVAQELSSGRQLLHASVNCINRFWNTGEPSITVRLVTGDEGDRYPAWTPSNEPRSRHTLQTPWGQFGITISRPPDRPSASQSSGQSKFQPWGDYRECLPKGASFVAIDLETTGIDARRHRIVEIGAIRVVGDDPKTAQFQRLLLQDEPLSDHIVRLTGITDDLVAGQGVDPCEALKELLEFIDGDPVVAFNATFDLAFLNAACERHSAREAARGGYSCALRLARRAWPDLASHKLAAVAAHCQLDLSNRHRALGDARRAAEVYRAASVAVSTVTDQ